MSNINTELNEAVSKGTNLSDAWNELMRKELEHAINELLQSELTSFLDYEKWDIAGYNSGNSRNGSYAREIVTRFGKISIEVPRDRNGDFQQHTVPKYRRSDGSLEEMVIQMYTKGITTSESHRRTGEGIPQQITEFPLLCHLWRCDLYQCQTRLCGQGGDAYLDGDQCGRA